MNRNQKIITVLCLVVTTLLLSSTFVTLNTFGYDWNLTETTTLIEHDNIAYGVIDGNHEIENQYLETEFAAQLRYIREASGSATASMNNGSTVFRKSFDSIYYDSFSRFYYEESEWKDHPTYLKVTNDTGYGPNFNFTVGLNDKGMLDLKSATTLELEAEVIYLFRVNLKAGEMFDLNIRTTALLNYLIYFNGVYSSGGSVNGVNRDLLPLVARDKGEYSIYFYSAAENYIIIQPREMTVRKYTVDSPIASRFVNEPDQVWNETKNLFEENRNKEAVHAFYFNIPAGAYEFKYIRFDAAVDTLAFVNQPSMYYDSSTEPSYMDMVLGFGTFEKYIWNFEYDTSVLVYILSERDPIDWIEFDYIFSIASVDVPTLESGVEHEYQDDLLSFAVNIEETQMVYLNHSGFGNHGMWIMNYVTDGMLYGNSYTLRPLGEDADKIILNPGYYYFFSPFVSTYDFDILLSTIEIEDYNGTETYTFNQTLGVPESYKLLKFEIPPNIYHNYNFTFTMPFNYTVEIEYEIFIGNYIHGSSYVETVGNQQDSGIFQGYDTNDTQVLSFYTLEDSVRYVLISVLDVYNNTGATWADYGTAYVNQTTVQITLKEDPDYPDAFNYIDMVFIFDAILDENGTWSGDYLFYDDGNDRTMYIINTTVPLYTWYTIKIFIINGTRSSVTYYLPHWDGTRPDEFRREAVWNKYYYKDHNSGTYFVDYDTTHSPDNTSYEIEFGILAPELIFMFNVYHQNLNGSISIEFIPHSCTVIDPYDIEELSAGLSAGGIIALAIIGGLVGATVIAVIVIKVIIPKVKTKTPSSPSY